FRSLRLLRMTRTKTGSALATAAALVLALPTRVSAHEIPPSVTVLAFVKPEPAHLRLVVRVPLEAIRDVKFPLRGPGYLELSKLDALLEDAATLWIANDAQLYEEDRRLTEAHIVAARLSLPSDRSFERYESAVAHVTGPS